MTPERQAEVNRLRVLLDHWMNLYGAVMAVDLTKREKLRRKIDAELKTKIEEPKPRE